MEPLVDSRATDIVNELKHMNITVDKYNRVDGSIELNTYLKGKITEESLNDFYSYVRFIISDTAQATYAKKNYTQLVSTIENNCSEHGWECILYKEDFDKFTENLHEVIDFIKTAVQNQNQENESFEPAEVNAEVDKTKNENYTSDIDFDDLGENKE